jgi:hypothetical protein
MCREGTGARFYRGSEIVDKTDKSKTYTFTFGGNKKLELDRPNLFLARYENLRRD